MTGQVLHETAATTSVTWQLRKVLCASIELILRVFLYGVLSVVACTLLCESGSTGSIPVGYPKSKIVYKTQSLIHIGEISHLSFGGKHIVHNNTANARITQA